MTQPAVEPLAQQVYDRLPQFMRDADPAQDFALLRFTSLVPGAIADVDELIERFAFDFPDGTSDLADPQTADAAWLPWLAQAVGVRLIPDSTEQEKRDAIGSATTGIAAGTRGSIAVAARSALTGTKYVDVRDHEGGDPWVIGVSTRDDETASVQAVLDAIEFAQARPAGFQIVYSAYRISWNTLEAKYPTWNAIEAATTWSNIESTLP